MNERNVVSGAVSVALSGMLDFLAPLKWLALLGLVLIIADLRFGVRAAKVRGETVRFSRAGRRTFNKKAWRPSFAGACPAVIYGFEINSCYSNYFESRGKKIKVDFLSVFRKKMDIIEVKEEKEFVDEHNK